MLQLPPKTDDLVAVELTPEEREVYAKLHKDAAAEFSRLRAMGERVINTSLFKIMSALQLKPPCVTLLPDLGVFAFALRCSRASTQPLRQATSMSQAELWGAHAREGTTRAGLLLPLRRVCSGGCLSQKDLEVKAGGAGGGRADGAGGDVQRPRGLLPCPDTVECSMCLEAPENPVRTCLIV